MQILMTSPSSYNISYNINPWMQDNVNKLDETRIRIALQQWSELRNILVGLGIDVIVLANPPKNCPDAVFTANAGFLYKDKFIPSFFKHAERQVEEPYFREWFVKKGFDVVDYDVDRTTTSFEGAGDALIDEHKNILWFGHGFRSTENFTAVLEYNYDLTVKPLRLIDSRFYHLDTCFCPLDNGKVLWYPGAFDKASQELITSTYGQDAIDVSEDDALLFACNAISIGKRIILPYVSAELLTKVIKAGLEPIRHSLSEFLKSGGSAKCLILKVQ